MYRFKIADFKMLKILNLGQIAGNYLNLIWFFFAKFFDISEDFFEQQMHFILFEISYFSEMFDFL